MTQQFIKTNNYITQIDPHPDIDDKFREDRIHSK